MHKTRLLTRAAVIAALYAALTLALAPISYGAVQLRVAEALTLLPLLWAEAIPGLFIGCFLANLIGGYGILDAVVGGLATLIAALLTRRLRRNAWLAALPPVLVNAVAIGLLLYFVADAPLWMTMLTVGAGQAAACYALGLPLLALLKKSGLAQKL
jgi:uncharacterized membrane protein